MSGVLNVIGGKGRVDRCPGASARAGATQRAQRFDDAALIVKDENERKSLRLLIGCVSVVSDL